MFEDNGYHAVAFEERADLYIINTCSVTDFADRKCRYEVRRALRYSPSAKIIVVGCYAQLKPKEISEIPGVDLVLGAAEKFNILQYIDDIVNHPGKGVIKSGDIREVNHFIGSFSIADRTRSFLKVQDGCDYKCSFCTIPQARGKSRSNTIEGVLQDAKRIIDHGVKEIVLTGVNLGDFGNGTEVIEGSKPAKDGLFIDLIKKLDRIEDPIRFRISSIEPNLLTDEIIEFVATSNHFMPHFHVPLQSGCNKILKAMRRRYLREWYASRVEKIKKEMPHACIGVDVIVGFPGETENDFIDSYHFIRDLDVSYLHVFTYSERSGTPAADLPGSIDIGERRRRNKMLRILSDKKKRAFYQSFKGKNRDVLFEGMSVEGKMTGYTDNYIQVQTPFNPKLINRVMPFRIEGINTDGTAYGSLEKEYIAMESI